MRTPSYRWRSVILLMLLLTACTSTLPAVTKISTTEIAGISIYPADLKLAPDGTAQLAYLSGGPSRELRFQPADGPFETVYTLEDPAQSGFGFSLALDSIGRPGIAYFNEQNDDLIYTERRDGRWISETIDSIGAVGYFASMAYDRHDQPHISYFDHSNNDIKYAMRTSQGWRIETIDTYGLPGFHIPAGFTQLALRCLPSADNCSTMEPIVLYLAYRYKPYDGELRAAYRSKGKGWQIETVDADRGAGGYLSLLLDSQGRPWVSYYRASTWDFAWGELRLAHYDGKRWRIEVVDEGEYVGRGSALALKSDERPVIAYYAASPTEIRLAVWRGHWSIEQLSDNDTVGSWVTMACDDQDRLHLAYADMSAQVTHSIVFTSSE